MRLGIASGAVSGNHETSCAQVLAALPMVAIEIMNPTHQHDGDRAGDTRGVLGARGERAEGAEHGGVERVAQQEPDHRPGDDAAPDGGNVDGVDHGANRARDERRGGYLSEAEQTDAGDLAGQEVAGRHAGEEYLDGAAGLLLHHAAENHCPVRADGAEENQGHYEGGRLVVRGAPGDLAELDVGDRHRLHHGQQLIGVDARSSGAVADGDELDGPGGDGLQLLVGLPLPLETAGIDDKHVDLLVADRLLTSGDGLIAVDADRGVDRVALSFEGGRQFLGDRAGEADVLGARARVEQRRERDGCRHRDQHQHDRQEEAAGAPPLADLAPRDQPALPDALHAATA